MIDDAFLPVLVDPGTPPVLLVGGSVLRRSTDRGESWTEVPGVAYVYRLAGGPGGTLWASGLGEVLRSTDRGESFLPWGDLPCAGGRVRVTPDPGDAAVVYASCENAGDPSDGFWRRRGEGDWSRLADPPAPPEETSWMLAVEPGSGRLAAVTRVDEDDADPGPPDERAFGGHLWLSEDGGATWRDATPVLACEVINAVAWLPDAPGHLLCGTFSADGTCPGILGRVLESFDAGTAWRDATGGLETPHAYDEGIHVGPDGEVYLGTWYEGFWRWVFPPPEPGDLHWEAGSKERLAWSATERASSWDAARGDLAALLADGGPRSGEALACRLAEPRVDDPSVPAPGTGAWYLVRAHRGPDPGTWGSADRDDQLAACR